MVTQPNAASRAPLDPIQRYRAQLSVGLTLFMLAFAYVYGITVRPPGSDSVLLAEFATQTFVQITYIGMTVAGAFTLWAVWRQQIRWAAAGPVIVWFFSGVLLAYRNGFSAGGELTVGIWILIGALLLGRAGLIITTVVGIIVLLYSVGLPEPIGNVVDPTTEGSSLVIQLGGMAIIAWLYLQTSIYQRQQVAQQSEAERGRLIGIAGSIAQQIAQRRSTDDVLNSAINQILENYPTIYHAQIFLIDDNAEEAQLRASTGEAGRALLQRRHSLPVGSRSVIGQVTALGEPVIARADTAESVHRANEFLRDTRIEMAFPLRVGSRTIGALDVQSRFPDGINNSDIPVFQLLADTIAVALDNGELFRLTQERLRDNQKLIEQMTRNAAEVRQLNEQLTQSAWTRFLEPYSGRIGVEVLLDSIGGETLSHVTPWREGFTTVMRDTVLENNPIQRPTSDGLIVCIPLRVRGLPLGALEMEMPDRAPLTDEEIDFAMKLTDRFGTMIEGLRMTEESRRSAQRESVLNTISARLQTSYDIDQLLGEAARGLQGALGAKRIAIRLGKPEGAENGATNGNTNSAAAQADKRSAS